MKIAKIKKMLRSTGADNGRKNRAESINGSDAGAEIGS
jgi:hypothetical protein